jgi:2,3-diketo-5-methylthio-1-phosphopentane phosphatase
MSSYVFIFDFDETLTVRSSHLLVEELASNKNALDLDDIDQRYINMHHCWNRRMNEVHQRLAQQGIVTEQLLEVFRTIELSPGTERLLQSIHEHSQQDKILVVSGACDLLIEQCLRAHHLYDSIEKIESNPVRQLQPILVIDEYERPVQTVCSICEPNLCKGLIIDRYRQQAFDRTIIFIGDGDNDVCPALHLNACEYVFAKYNEQSKRTYALYEQLTTTYASQLKAKLFVWQTMNDVHRILIDQQIL